MNKYGSQKPHIRFRTPEQLQGYLERAGNAEFNFRAYPISGSPETFHYSGEEKVVTRENDRKSFDNLEDFTCYTFQCDAEGYSHTEYVDFELLN
ncbi:hypothetical protein [Desulfoscipio gibsoniae]|uniref:Uncharacterized protein n=1 Tax=Desulfoscipio gibsoniae DSM 7213 TaxID=767817 RepID=R4KV08_9FIRM|nr:hypothetical protein [Desulfoscipio gibsoniae]AGL03451.1 hypothetical protein Desgi_4197 [Desulfoscipio gibsoniae DSM 7213]